MWHCFTSSEIFRFLSERHWRRTCFLLYVVQVLCSACWILTKTSWTKRHFAEPRKSLPKTGILGNQDRKRWFIYVQFSGGVINNEQNPCLRWHDYLRLRIRARTKHGPPWLGLYYNIARWDLIAPILYAVSDSSRRLTYLLNRKLVGRWCTILRYAGLVAWLVGLLILCDRLRVLWNDDAAPRSRPTVTTGPKNCYM